MSYLYFESLDLASSLRFFRNIDNFNSDSVGGFNEDLLRELALLLEWGLS